jgi:hypothetical protein
MSEDVVRKFLRNLKMYKEKFLGNFPNLQPHYAAPEQIDLHCRLVSVTYTWNTTVLIFLLLNISNHHFRIIHNVSSAVDMRFILQIREFLHYFSHFV